MRILVPRFIDRRFIRAQEDNVRPMLSHFSMPGNSWEVFHFGAPDLSISRNPLIRPLRMFAPLPPRYSAGHATSLPLANHLWKWELALRFARKVDAIFYAGRRKHAAAGLFLRRILGRKVPVITSLEGLIGDAARAADFSRRVGHPVFLDRASKSGEKVLRQATHVIAITPLLKRMIEEYYGVPCSYLPLGVDSDIFHPRGRQEPERPRVICAGTLNDRKRPEAFVKLAMAFPDASFVWFGEGAKRPFLEQMIQEKAIRNLHFPGSVPPDYLALEMRRSSFFVLPSLSEGSPKVIHGAQACGLAAIAFGHYETPLVRHERNGLVVWDDEELVRAVDRLLSDQTLRESMGRQAALDALELDWKQVAPRWEKAVLEVLSRQG